MKTKKVLLIRPQTLTGNYAFVAKQFPMNIAGLASYLIAGGVEAKICDYDVERFDEASFASLLKDFAPSIVGISCCTPTVINGHRIAECVKRSNANIITIVGGTHASSLPERTLKEFPSFDIVVVGEGEETLSEICRQDDLSPDVLVTISGLAFRNGEQIVKTPRRSLIADLDVLPFPARELLPMHLYKGQSHRGFSRDFLKITELMTSRGCPAKCIFCASEITMGRNLRFRSAENVKAEISLCVERFGFNHFSISDDTFTLDAGRLENICAHFKRLNVTWNCNSRVWPMSRDILDMMISSGCTGITFGVESGSPRILELIGKNITIEHIKNAFQWARQSGIKIIEADLIIGSHPSETYEDVELSVKLIKEIRPDLLIASIIVPYPGTKVNSLMREKGLMSLPEKWDDYLLFGSKPSWYTECFSSEELVAIQKRVLRNFYLDPRYILNRLVNISNLSELKYWVRAGVEFVCRA